MSPSFQFGILFNPLKSHLLSDVLMQYESSFLSFPYMQKSLQALLENVKLVIISV